MIERPTAIARVRELFRTHPCVAILGPRQCGKTTLARMVAADEPDCVFFDLESPLDARRLDAPIFAQMKKTEIRDSWSRSSSFVTRWFIPDSDIGRK